MESIGQQAQLESLGCRLAQGYLYARPQPPDVLGATLTERGRTPLRSHAAIPATPVGPAPELGLPLAQVA